MPPSRTDGPRGFRYRHALEIRFADTDALGHVNNAVYLSYFEAARAGYYAALTGRAFGSGPDPGRGTFVIAEAHIAYRSPAVFGEPLSCGCRASWIGGSAFGLEYRLETEPSPLGEARLVAEGSTVQVFFDLARSAVVRMPPGLRAGIIDYEGTSLPGRPPRSGHA